MALATLSNPLGNRLGVPAAIPSYLRIRLREHPFTQVALHRRQGQTRLLGELDQRQIPVHASNCTTLRVDEYVLKDVLCGCSHDNNGQEWKVGKDEIAVSHRSR